MVTKAPVLTKNVSNNYKQYVSYNLVNRPDNFVARKTASHRNTWYKITSDRWILKTIYGYAVEITCKPYQFQVPNPIKFSDLEQSKIDQELTEFLIKGSLNQYIQKIKRNLFPTFLFDPNQMGESE